MITTPQIQPHALPSENASLTAAQYGMLAFLVSEVAFFGTLVVAYVAYIGQDVNGPRPRDVLSLPLVLATTACLLASSATIHVAQQRLEERRIRSFSAAWITTIMLGTLFMLGTAYEWWTLIFEHQLTIGRNLFGTTFYTLVGFHGLHVTLGLLAMLVTLILVRRGRLRQKEQALVQLVAWYWHFVDGVWLVVFSVVYVIGR
jgi:cytochrome c oxidase subunit 3/cytochrome o ubiquinol oxidase subunit 3